jgi:hypothetical protein
MTSRRSRITSHSNGFHPAVNFSRFEPCRGRRVDSAGNENTLPKLGGKGDDCVRG